MALLSPYIYIQLDKQRHLFCPSIENTYLFSIFYKPSVYYLQKGMKKKPSNCSVKLSSRSSNNMIDYAFYKWQCYIESNTPTSKKLQPKCIQSHQYLIKMFPLPVNRCVATYIPNILVYSLVGTKKITLFISKYIMQVCVFF